MINRRTIITVVNSLGATSMPYNEFVIYRAHRFPDERHVLLVLERCAENNYPVLPDNVQVLYCRGSLLRLWKLMRTLSHQPAGTQLIVHLHQPKSGLAYLLCRPLSLRTVPVLYTVHSMFRNYKFANKILCTLSAVAADHITCVSHATYHALPCWLRKFKRITVVPNGVDLERVDTVLSSLTDRYGTAVKEGSRTLELVSVGRLVGAKNQQFLIRLLQFLPKSVTLTIVGDGPLRGTLESLAKAENVADRVRFLGLVPREQVYQVVRKADLFVSASLWEGLPIAVLEAMALGMPAVLSDIGPHREIARWADHIALIPLDPSSWVKSITQVLDMPTSTKASLGRRSRRAVEEHFSLLRMHDDYTQLYERLSSGVRE